MTKNLSQNYPPVNKNATSMDYVITPRDKLLALKLIMECNEAKFALFKEGPAIMQVKSMEERLANIESRDQSAT